MIGVSVMTFCLYIATDMSCNTGPIMSGSAVYQENVEILHIYSYLQPSNFVVSVLNQKVMSGFADYS